MNLVNYLKHVFIYLVFYIGFNSQGHIATGSLHVEETSAYYIVNHRASASNYQLSNMKRPAPDSNQRPQRLEACTLPLHHRAPYQAGWPDVCNKRQDGSTAEKWKFGE